MGPAFELETAENNVGMFVDELNVSLALQSEKEKTLNSNLSDHDEEIYDDDDDDDDDDDEEEGNLEIVYINENEIDPSKKNSKIIRSNNKPTKCTH